MPSCVGQGDCVTWLTQLSARRRFTTGELHMPACPSALLTEDCSLVLLETNVDAS